MVTVASKTAKTRIIQWSALSDISLNMSARTMLVERQSRSLRVSISVTEIATSGAELALAGGQFQFTRRARALNRDWIFREARYSRGRLENVSRSVCFLTVLTRSA